MKDLIWDIAKSGEQVLENTELQSIEEPKELFVARGVSLEAKDSTYKINRFVDNKIAHDVKENGAIKISDTVFNYSKSYKTKTIDLKRLLEWATSKNSVRLLGPVDAELRAPTVALDIKQSPKVVAEKLARKGIMAGSGDFYAVRALEAHGIDTSKGVLRLSYVHYTNRAEIEKLVDALDTII